ncbi:MAG: peptide chain release factor N(5)-glutamine methyltransferase [Firmicutes bacterium]|nr:peptide chain release factor N(5)-glutamine methyltransferase [Bacillota bacterium]
MSLTIQEALQRASFQLRQTSLAQPRREAEALLCAAIGKSLAWVYAHGEEIMPDKAVDIFTRWVQRRGSGEPYAYLCGEREFLGLPFTVTPAVLIPRPETELLVEAVVQQLQNIKSPRILDVGVGSGAIAVSLATLLPQATITAVDIDPAALSVAAQNAKRHQVDARIRFLQGDLYAPVASEEFTAVVSNPPYIPTAEIVRLDATVKDYEPRRALDGGPDGLTFYRRLAGELSTLAAPPSLLAFEIGEGQGSAIINLCHSVGYKNTCQISDLAGIARIILAEQREMETA